jgi:hypothetical protein
VLRKAWQKAKQLNAAEDVISAAMTYAEYYGDIPKIREKLAELGFGGGAWVCT